MRVTYQQLSSEINLANKLLLEFPDKANQHTESRFANEHIAKIVELSKIQTVQIRDPQAHVNNDDYTKITTFRHSIARGLFYQLQITHDKATKNKLAELLSVKVLGRNPNASHSTAKLKKVLMQQGYLPPEPSNLVKFLQLSFLSPKQDNYTKLVTQTTNKIINNAKNLQKHKQDDHFTKASRMECYETLFLLSVHNDLEHTQKQLNALMNNKVHAIVGEFIQKKNIFYTQRYNAIRNSFLKYLQKDIQPLGGYDSKIDPQAYALLNKLNFLGNKKCVEEYYREYFYLKDDELKDNPKKLLDDFLLSIHNSVTTIQCKNLRPYGIDDAQKKDAIVMALKKDANRLSKKSHLSNRLTSTHKSKQYRQAVAALLDFCEPSLRGGLLTEHKIRQIRYYLKNLSDTPAKTECQKLEKLYSMLLTTYKKSLNNQQLVDVCRKVYLKKRLNDNLCQQVLQNQSWAKKELLRFMRRHFDEIISTNRQQVFIVDSSNNNKTEDDYYLETCQSRPLTLKEYAFRTKKRGAILFSNIASGILAIGQGITAGFALYNYVFIAIFAFNPVTAFAMALLISFAVTYLNYRLFDTDVTDTLIKLFIKGDWFNGETKWYKQAIMLSTVALSLGMGVVMGALTFTAALTIPFWSWSAPLAMATAIFFGGATTIGFVGLMYTALASVTKQVFTALSILKTNYSVFFKRSLKESAPRPINEYFNRVGFIKNCAGIYYTLKILTYSPLKGLLAGTVYSLFSILAVNSPASQKALSRKVNLINEQIALLAGHPKRKIKLERKRDLLQSKSFSQLWFHVKAFWNNPIGFDQSRLNEVKNTPDWKHSTKKERREKLLNEKVKEILGAEVEINDANPNDNKLLLTIRNKIIYEERVKKGSYLVGLCLKPLVALPIAAFMIVTGTVSTLLGWEPLFSNFLTAWLSVNQTVATAVSYVMVFACTGLVNFAFNLRNETKFFDWISDLISTGTSIAAVTLAHSITSAAEGLLYTATHPVKQLKSIPKRTEHISRQLSAAVINAWDNPRKYVYPKVRYLLFDLIFNTVCLVANASGFAALSLAGAKTPLAKIKSFSSVLVTSLSCNSMGGIIPKLRKQTPNCNNNHIKHMPPAPPGAFFQPPPPVGGDDARAQAAANNAQRHRV